MRTQVEWKVESQTPSASGPSSFATRSRISPAALFVKVTARIASGAMPHTPISQATRLVSTRVFPLPAPASTRSGPSVAWTASRCSGFRPSRSASASTSWAPGGRSGDRRTLAAPRRPARARPAHGRSSFEEDRARPGGAVVALEDAHVEPVAARELRQRALHGETAFALAEMAADHTLARDELDGLDRAGRGDLHAERPAPAGGH